MTDSQARRRAWTLIGASYLVLSLALLWPVLRAGAGHHAVWIEGDASFAVWANGWAAHAIAHFHNPFFSPTVWSPRGVNLLANTTSVGLAILFTPVTWVVGPVAAFNLQMILVPVVSALAMCLAVRPWVRSSWSVWLAGLTWGFCPVALESLNWGWTNFLYLATAPLVFWLLCDLLHFKRHSPRFVGVALSVVVTIQFTIGAEMLALVAILAVISVAGVAVVTAVRDRALVVASWPAVLRAGLWSLPVLVVVLAPLVLFTVLGPAHLPNWVYGRAFLRHVTFNVGLLVSHAVGRGAFHAHWVPVYPSPDYFGVVLLVVFVAVLVWLWREPLSWLLAFVAVVCFWLGLGSKAVLHPWAVLWSVPVIHNIIASRFIYLLWFPVVIVVARGFDRLLEVLATQSRALVRVGLAIVFPLVAFGQLALAMSDGWHVVPQAVVNDQALPVVAAATSAPRFITFPFPLSGRSMVQQAGGAFNYALLGGWGPEVRVGTPREIAVRNDFIDLSEFYGPQRTPAQLAQMGAQIAAWRVTDVITPLVLSYPLTRGYVQPSAVIATMVEMYGAPSLVRDNWVWRVHARTATTRTLSGARWYRCTVIVYGAHPGALPACVTRALGQTAS